MPPYDNIFTRSDEMGETERETLYCVHLHWLVNTSLYNSQKHIKCKYYGKRVLYNSKYYVTIIYLRERHTYYILCTI